MTYALIGCGRISKNHITAAFANNLDIVAVCDLIPERMDALCSDFSLPKEQVRRFTDYRELVDTLRPQLVAVATESGSHAKIALYCIERCCNVIIEKPIALSLADADEIIFAAAKYNVAVCACHQNRFNKAVRRVQTEIAHGALGKLMYISASVRWRRDTDYYRQAAWRGTWQHDGGALMNQCIHNIDLLRWFANDEITEVFAYTANQTHPYIEAEDLGLALVRFAGGGYGILDGTTSIYPSNLEETLSFFGERGSVKLGGKSVNRIENWQVADSTLRTDELGALNEAPPDVYGFGHTPLYADVIAAINEHRAPFVDAEAGRRALELVLAIYKSSAENRVVHLPLRYCATTDFIK